MEIVLKTENVTYADATHELDNESQFPITEYSWDVSRIYLETTEGESLFDSKVRPARLHPRKKSNYPMLTELWGEIFSILDGNKVLFQTGELDYDAVESSFEYAYRYRYIDKVTFDRVSTQLRNL